MKQMWWKYMAATLLLVVVLFSLKTPLSPGILSIHDPELAPDDATLSIIGYQTHFKSSDDLQVWLEAEKWTVCATELTPIDDTHLLASFDINQAFRSDLLSLFINNSKDGTILRIEEVYTRDLKVDSSLSPQKCFRPVTLTDHAHFSIPNRVILWETIRNLNFHVPMWFAMFFLMGMSMILSIRYLSRGREDLDLRASSAVKVGLVFAFAGLATGALWGRFTWGTFWTNDSQLNGAALTTMIYLAYLILRGNIKDRDQQARISAVYNIFAFAMLLLFIYVIPNVGDGNTLHPGKDSNPAFSNYDLDNKLRMLFYPSVIAWMLVGYWIYSLRFRLESINKKLDDRYDAI